MRKKLNKEDAEYKRLLHATHQAKRALDDFLIAIRPEIPDWPKSRKNAELEILRRRFRKSEGYQKLVAAQGAAQKKLEAAYPKAFVSDQALNAARKAEQEKIRNHPSYKKIQKDRAEIAHTRDDYLFASDQRLKELKARLEKAK